MEEYNELGGIGQLDLEGRSVCMKTMALYSHAQSLHFTASLCDSETSELLPGMGLASQLLTLNSLSTLLGIACHVAESTLSPFAG